MRGETGLHAGDDRIGYDELVDLAWESGRFGDGRLLANSGANEILAFEISSSCFYEAGEILARVCVV
jgi:hypothetical protein